jgi:deoxyribonuclease V
MASRPPTVAEVEQVSSFSEAISIQAKIERLVRIPADDDESTTRQRAGCRGPTIVLALDIAYSTQSNLAVASGVLYRYDASPAPPHPPSSLAAESKDAAGTSPRSTPVEEEGEGIVLAEKVASGRVTFPYQPGLLAFREIPLLSRIIEDFLPSSSPMKCKDRQDAQGGDSEKEEVILLCDGAGIAHPRFCGIACHLGVLYQCPSIGVAKNHLVGDFCNGGEATAPPLDVARGSHARLQLQDRSVGTILRTQTNIRPIYVSPGHLVSIQRANDLVLSLCHRYRIAEPLRRADHIGRMELKRLEHQERDSNKCKAV